jgi:hypothetical protein
MRERLIEIVAGLSLRRATPIASPEPVIGHMTSNVHPTRYPHSKQNVNASAWYVEDADDEMVARVKPEPLKLRKKPKRRALG